MKCSTIAVIAVLLPGVVSAQLPGTRVVATPRLRSVTRVGDTTVVTYSVLVSPKSAEHLFGFTISVAAPVVAVVSPGPDSVWSSANTFEGKPVAGWWSANTVAPGDSTPTLVYKALGLPGLATGWLTGDGVTKDTDTGTDNGPAYEWLESMSAKIASAVGVYPASTAQPAVSDYLRAQTDAVCAARWIVSHLLCSALHGLATNDYASLRRYGVSLDSARKAGSAVTGPAYWILSINQAYALAHTDRSQRR